MKTIVYAGRSNASGNRVMFYKKPSGQWRFNAEGGRWITVPWDIPHLYNECSKYLVNNFKEKHKDD